MRAAPASIMAVLAVVLFTACAPATPTASPAERAGTRSDPVAPTRTLVMVVKLEPVGMFTKLLVGQNNTRSARRLVNAPLAVNDGFANHPHWNHAFVGTGPFRLERWDPGVAIELRAFPGHAGGKAKIDSVRLRWIEDPNTALANLLSGEVHVAVNDSIRFQQGSILRQQWAATNGGNVLISARETRFVQIQFSPQFNQTKALLDLRVRRALAHSLDKQAIIDGVLNGEGTVAETLMSPQMPYYAALMEAIPKYPYDLQRAEQLMRGAGFTRPPGGSYVGASGERFDPEFRAFGGGQEETELAIMVDGLNRAGMAVVPNVVPAVYSRDVQIRASFPGLTANVTQLAERTVFNKLQSFNIPLETNRWAGFNRGAWVNAEFDRLDGLFNTTLDRAARDQIVINMMRIVNEDVGVIPLYYNLDSVAHVGALVGPTTAAPDTARDWNVHEWYWLR